MAFIKKRTMEPGPREDIERVMCSLCDGLLEEPRSLPCSHNFCRACLQHFCLTNAGDTGFNCPECRKMVSVKDPQLPIIEWASEFKVDTFTQTLLGRSMKLAKERIQKRCSFCAIKYITSLATKYCQSCKEYFCDECGNQHWILRASKEHRVWLVEDLKALKLDSLLRASLELVFNARIRQPKRLSHSSEGRSPSDEFDVKIGAATFLSNSSVIVADIGNRKLKLFDKYRTFVASYSMDCGGVLGISDNYFVVTGSNESIIRSASVFQNMLVEEDEVETGGPCSGICLLEPLKFAVVLVTRPVKIKVFNMLDISETIEVKPGLLQMFRPQYLAYSKEYKLFFLSDPTYCCLKCITDAGEIVWERRLDGCKGLVAFGQDVLVARPEQHTVDLINKKGQLLKSIIRKQDGFGRVSVLAIDNWHQTTKEANVLVADDTDLLRVVRLEDPQRDSDIRMFTNVSSPHLTEHSVDSEDSSITTDAKRRQCVIL